MRDKIPLTDKEDKDMKKSKAVIASAMIFCAAANFTACVYGPPQAVYGPPVDYQSESEETGLTEEEDFEDKEEDES